MNTNLNPADVVAWMREQSRSFTAMADQIESTFKLNGSMKAQAVDDTLALPEKISSMMEAGKSRRILQLARELGVTREEIRSAVEASDVLSCNERGWVSGDI